ncbi:hypothetical protein P3T73_06795 [Kiritimatiellota bacterium B12222]|nr:hypothetical protein P3T73_06795 [Kiritimatiellota bacterium B12222]
MKYLLCVCLVSSFALFAQDVGDEEAMLLGYQVMAVQEALRFPEQPESLEAIKGLGLDSRYYVMVRGWLVQEIKLAESYRDRSDYTQDSQRQLDVEKRISALQKALRMIDLE